MFSWRPDENDLLIITKYPPYLFHWAQSCQNLHCWLTELKSYCVDLRDGLTSKIEISGHATWLHMHIWAMSLENLSYANSKDADQHAHPRSLILRYSAGEEKSPYFLFHGETPLHKILKFQGETANFSEKFQGEIAEFLRENMELYRQNPKISGRNTGISWRKYWISWRNLEKFSTISPRKKGSWSWRKIKSGDFSSPAL